MVSKTAKAARRIKRQVRKERGSSCQVWGCTRTRNLQMAHVRKSPLSGTGPGRGMYNRAIDWLDHPGSYKLVCPQHHSAIQSGARLKFRGV